MQLDEATATAAYILIENHIQALKAWQRKLRQPYMPTTRLHFSVVPAYPKPTLQMVGHIITSAHTFATEIERVAEQIEKEKA